MRDALVEALRVVAAEPDVQVEHLDALRAVAREVRQGVRDIVLVDEKLAREGQIPAEAAARVRELDGVFDRMLAAGDDMFTEAALREAPEWDDARRIGRRALRALGEDP